MFSAQACTSATQDKKGDIENADLIGWKLARIFFIPESNVANWIYS